MSLNNSRIPDYLYLANSNDLEVKDISDVKKSTSHLDVNRETEEQNSMTKVTSLFQYRKSTFLSPVAIFQQHQRTEFTFHNTNVIQNLCPIQ